MTPVPDILAHYQPVIGLEIHIQLQAATKVFAPESFAFGQAPNSSVSAVTLAHPGALPYPNLACVAHLVHLGLATHCEVNPHSYFARKNYFYPDLPKGYQLSQDQQPLCRDGYLDVPLSDGHCQRVRVERIHLEEDAGKSIHDQDPTRTLIDLNRAGTGLAELVTHPDLRSAEEAGALLAEVRRIVRYLGVSDANMEQGNLRCDANVSVMRHEAEAYGTRVEIKNLNSINFLMRAITHEVERQVAVIESGGRVEQQTRLWDAGRQRTYAMRDKETAQDYRYFPDPDMLPIAVSAEEVARTRAALPTLPAERWQRYLAEVGLGANEAFALIEERAFSDYFEALCEVLLRDQRATAKVAANWMLGPVRSQLKERGQGIEAWPLAPAQFAALISLVESRQVSFSAAKDQLLPALIEQPQAEVVALAQSLNLMLLSDTSGLAEAMDRLMAQSPQEVKRYQQGKKKLLGYFVGQLMREFKGKADPQEVNRVVREKLRPPG